MAAPADILRSAYRQVGQWIDEPERGDPEQDVGLEQIIQARRGCEYDRDRDQELAIARRTCAPRPLAHLVARRLTCHQRDEDGRKGKRHASDVTEGPVNPRSAGER